MKRTILALVLLGVLPTNAFGDIFDNVYYKLYQTRLEIAEISAKKQLVSLEKDKIELRRHRTLFEKEVISAQEFENYKLIYDLSVLSLEDLKAKKSEAKAMLDIVIDRVQLGLDMPICPNVPQ